MTEFDKETLSEQEADLYDRQIRLWGVESQNRLRKSDILLINVRSLGSEIAKNIILSGVRSVTILDDGIVTEDDISTNFLLSRDCLGKNIAESVLLKAQALNPMVKITADKDGVSKKDDLYYKSFTLIVATKLSSSQLISINQVCRANDIQFMCADASGLFGYSFSDLQMHDYYEDVAKSVPSKKRDATGKLKYEKIVESVKGSATYVPFQDALGVDWSKEDADKISLYSPQYFLFRVLLNFRDQIGNDPRNPTNDEARLKQCRDNLLVKLGLPTDKAPDALLNRMYGVVPPVCSVLGGVVAQEIIKAVSHKEVPINNMLFFDSEKYSSRIECVGA